MQVTFLYQLQDGACPKSYGTACARLAGMPDAILDRAEALAAQLEASGSPTAAQAVGQPTAHARSGALDIKEMGTWLRGFHRSLEPASGRGDALVSLQQEARKLGAS